MRIEYPFNQYHVCHHHSWDKLAGLMSPHIAFQGPKSSKILLSVNQSMTRTKRCDRACRWTSFLKSWSPPRLLICKTDAHSVQVSTCNCRIFMHHLKPMRSLTILNRSVIQAKFSQSLILMKSACYCLWRTSLCLATCNLKYFTCDSLDTFLKMGNGYMC